MELFLDDGHLTGEALDALIRQEALTELQRLEIAEHLSYCDGCLLRYTRRLEKTPLPEPEVSCGRALRRRLRLREVRLTAGRCAAAAAAVAVVVAAVWTHGLPGRTEMPETQAEHDQITQTLQSWPERWNLALERQMGRLDQAFDFFGGAGTQAAASQGGANS